jgi:hypothetical protein
MRTLSSTLFSVGGLGDDSVGGAASRWVNRGTVEQFEQFRPTAASSVPSVFG